MSKYEKDFIEIKKLGKGGFGEVFMVQNKYDSQKYAIKRIQFSAEESNEAEKFVKREVESLAALQHSNVVRYHTSWFDWIEIPNQVNKNEKSKLSGYGSFSDLSNSQSSFSREFNDTSGVEVNFTATRNSSSVTTESSLSRFLCIQMQLCDSSLDKWLKTRNKNITANFLSPNDVNSLLNIYKQLLDALAYIHRKSILHRDLKPGNILLNGEKPHVLLGDFGLSRMISIETSCGDNSSKMPVEDASSKMPVEDTISKMPIEDTSYEMPVEDTSSEMPVEDTSSEMPVEDISSKMTVEDTSSKMPVEDTSSEMPVEDTSSEMPVEDTSSKMPVEDISSKMTVEDTSSKMPVEDTSSKMPIEDTSSEMPVEDTSSKMPVEDTSSKMPVEDTSSKMPVEDTSSEMPVEDISSKMPVEDTSSKMTVEDTSSKMPVEETSSEMPIEDTSSEMPVQDTSSKSSVEYVDKYTPGRGSKLYAAPEQMDTSDYDFKADMYSAGVTLYEMTSIFGESQHERIKSLQNLRKKNFELPEDYVNHYKNIAPVIVSLMSTDPKTRPSAEELLKSALFLQPTEVRKANEIEELQKENAALRKCNEAYRTQLRKCGKNPDDLV